MNAEAGTIVARLADRLETLEAAILGLDAAVSRGELDGEGLRLRRLLWASRRELRELFVELGGELGPGSPGPPGST